MFLSCKYAALALPIRAFTSASDPPCSSMMLPNIATAGMLSVPAVLPILICLMAMLISSIDGGPTLIGSNLKSTGGTIPRLYGLPNLHKVGLPNRFILDMAGMEQYCESKAPLYGVLPATRNNGLILRSLNRKTT
ncbi:unnamed protein product [Schistosoma margrebowiei]|uniref:Uncharacterized protein n=1 Tax=Schistosoma margrebowiei TaxID=48269 RepID=A0A183LIW5_9TREM|nr:unnamed protein product [Schistosoma margrebowiei]